MSIQTVGVLALQGNFAMHAAACEQAGARVQFVKTPAQLQDIDGLVLPGGESTVMLKHFDADPSWWSALQAFHAAEKPMFGTCAGLILLARTVYSQPKSAAPPRVILANAGIQSNPLQQRSLGFLDISVERNAYGRQRESHEIHARFKLGQDAFELDMPFIRAPKIIDIGPQTTPIAWVGDQVVMVQQGHVLGAACHPEATTMRVHQYFLSF